MEVVSRRAMKVVAQVAPDRRSRVGRVCKEVGLNSLSGADRGG